MRYRRAGLMDLFSFCYHRKVHSMTERGCAAGRVKNLHGNLRNKDSGFKKSAL